MKTHIVQQINVSYDIISVEMLTFGKHGIEWGISMMKVSYKLTKRTTKAEKFEKYLKT